MRDRYEEHYKYGYKIGRYQSCYKTVLVMFDEIYELDFKDEKQKIRWLSNYELNLLEDLLFESYSCKRRHKKGEEKLNEIKEKIVEMLK